MRDEAEQTYSNCPMNKGEAITDSRMCLFLQRGSSDVSAHRSLQENETSQGFDILPGVDTGWTADGDRKQRQDCQTDALQCRHIKSRR